MLPGSSAQGEGSQEAVSRRKLQLLDFVHSGHSVALGSPRESFAIQWSLAYIGTDFV